MTVLKYAANASSSVALNFRSGWESNSLIRLLIRKLLLLQGNEGGISYYLLHCVLYTILIPRPCFLVKGNRALLLHFLVNLSGLLLTL
ncbi:hypothetical protein SDC9_120466 [bioreactor metagenome]|uniref:Uncharacterized protein n=1 Tax=bioreactor metagenome TaxID=1076179 RepID=A0A645C6R5_9ZZZZ